MTAHGVVRPGSVVLFLLYWMVTRYSIGEDSGLVEDPRDNLYPWRLMVGSTLVLQVSNFRRVGKHYCQVSVAIIDNDGNLCNNKERGRRGKCVCPNDRLY